MERAVAAENSGHWEAPKTWKLLGDEVVLAAEIGSDQQIGALVKAFSQALHDRNNNSKHGAGGRDQFKIKGAGWIAGFPVANAIVPLRIPLGTGGYDYLGTSMDTGFRIAKNSTPRFMAISVELAWMLLIVGDQNIKIGYRGRRPLEGVTVEGGYPLFFVDIGASQLETLEDRIYDASHGHPNAMPAFCEAFIEAHGRPRHLPFIKGDSKFGREPANYQERLAQIRADHLKDVFYLVEPTDGHSTGAESDSATKKQILETIEEIAGADDDPQEQR